MDKPIVTLIHGFGSDGSLDVEKLAPHFEAAGYEVRRQYYGVKGLIGVRRNNPREAEKLALSAPAGSIVVAHSNGCTIGQLASLNPIARFTRLVLISPALKPKAVFGPSLERVIVLYSKHDLVTRLIGWIPFNDWWGEMGTVGYKGTDPRVGSYDKENDPELNSWSHVVDQFFDEEKVAHLGRWIIKKLAA